MPESPSVAARRRRRRRVGLMGAVVGLAAAGVAAGVTTQRVLLRRERDTTGDLYAAEPFGQLPYDESITVRSGGLDLYVEIVEPADGIDLELDLRPGEPIRSEPTLVFIHGFCLDMGTFHFQRAELTRDGSYRMVFFDQPGHGRSQRKHSGEYTLDDLGKALADVLDATVPDGPIILIGHSMGGMSVMALAEQRPELFGERIVGAALISTSAGKLDEVTFGMPDFLVRFTRPLVPAILGSGRLTGSAIDSLRRASGDLAWLLTRRYGFGSGTPSPSLVSYVQEMNARTSTEVVARYLRALFTHARYPALAALRQVPVLVVCGDSDQLTPPSHAEEICDALPDAKLVIVPDAGHVALLEKPDVVNAALEEFLAEVG